MSPGALVYKVLTRADWRAAEQCGLYEGSPDDLRDGFIHLSTEAQLAGTLARHFAGQRDLVVVSFEASALGSALRYEPSRGGALFPHLYAALPTSLAREVRLLSDGDAA